MIRFSHIAWALLTATSVLLFFWTAQPLPLACAVALAAVPAVGVACVKAALPRLSASIEAPTTVQKGAPACCRLVVENRSRIPFSRVELPILVQNLLTGQVERLALSVAVGPRETASASFTLASAVCGRLLCQAPRLRAYELLGLFRITRPCSLERRLSVMPTLYDVALSDVYAASPLSDTVLFSSLRKGPDASEVFGLREYQPGDSLRAVHWKLSEKIDELIVREPSLPIDSSLLVFWNKALPMAPEAQADDVQRPLAADAMAEVVLALCQRLSDNAVEYEAAANDAASGRCFAEHVGDAGDVYELIGSLMSSPVAPGVDGLEAYLREFGRLTCSRLIYVGAQLPAQLDEVRRGRSVLAFVCDGGDGLRMEPGYAEVHFASGDVAAALASAGVM
ncbi:MAG: DUF58 domain-containing protein [Coriobacteriales bacterium]|nr:DUF58 domain-containing protein [Coriobacteriales bacterium]